MLNLGQIQGKLALVRVSGEFELSKFELAGFYCIVINRKYYSSIKAGSSKDGTPCILITEVEYSKVSIFIHS